MDGTTLSWVEFDGAARQCFGGHSWIEVTVMADEQREYLCLHCPAVRHEPRT